MGRCNPGFHRFMPLLVCAVFLGRGAVSSQTLRDLPALDQKVRAFLDRTGHGWYDMNVPVSDGQLLHRLILDHGYTRALEIGTSTGHSGIWMAWALARTGGKLITVEIDEDRHRAALKNFEEAGLSDFIDARLADAHDLVKRLAGPFDFVFSDADKNWYQRYFIDVDPRLLVGGCYATHNVSERRRYGGNAAYLAFLRSLPHYETSVDESGGGMAISIKRSEKQE